MAKLLFNRLSPGFKQTAMVDLMLDEGVTNPARHLEAALASLGAKPRAGCSAAELLDHFYRFVASNKVLLVLDNVSDFQQLDALLPTEFCPGSKIIITSRHITLDGSSALREVSSSEQQCMQALPS
jgi:hypothetical protein